MCGNGIRCFAKYVFDRRILGSLESGTGDDSKVDSSAVKATKKRKLSTSGESMEETKRVSSPTSFRVHTSAGLIVPQVQLNSAGEASRVRVNMGAAVWEASQVPVNTKLLNVDKYVMEGEITVDGNSVKISAVRVGVPHVIICVPKVSDVNVARLGALLESNVNLFPEKANVGFMEVVNAREFKYRVWERGAGETLACGTGCCAATAVGVMLGKLDAGHEVVGHMDGGDLSVLVERKDVASAIWMTGEAVTVYTGTVPFDRLVDTLPPPPCASPLSFCKD